MSQSEHGGCGCLALIGVLLILLCIYPVYDGYVYRDLPKKEKAAIEAKATIKGIERYRYLSVVVSNPTEWIIGHATIKLTITLKDGTRREFTGRLKRNNSTKLDISWRETDCEFPLPDDASALFALEEFDNWNWQITDLDGRRNPIRLVKRPVDWVLSLFDRVD